MDTTLQPLKKQRVEGKAPALKRAGSSLEVPDEESHVIFQNMMITIKTLTLQNQKLAEFQEKSYLWHLQHHENIKRIISGINVLGEALTKLGMKTSQIETFEDQALVSTTLEYTPQKISSSCHTSLDDGINLHDIIIRNKQNRGEIGENMSRYHEEKYLKTLKGDSVEIILPIIHEWLLDCSNAKLAFIYLIESVKMYPDVFSKTSNAKQVALITEAMEILSSEEQFEKIIPCDLEAVKELYSFLLGALE